MKTLYIEVSADDLVAAILPAEKAILEEKISRTDIPYLVYGQIRVDPEETELYLPQHPFEDRDTVSALIQLPFHRIQRPLLHELRFSHKSGLLVSFFAHTTTINAYFSGKDVPECYEVMDRGESDRNHRLLEHLRESNTSATVDEVSAIFRRDITDLDEKTTEIAQFYFLERGLLERIEMAAKSGPLDTRAGLVHNIEVARCEDQIEVIQRGIRKFRGFESCMVGPAREGFTACDP